MLAVWAKMAKMETMAEADLMEELDCRACQEETVPKDIQDCPDCRDWRGDLVR